MIISVNLSARQPVVTPHYQWDIMRPGSGNHSPFYCLPNTQQVMHAQHWESFIYKPQICICLPALAGHFIASSIPWCTLHQWLEDNIGKHSQPQWLGMWTVKTLQQKLGLRFSGITYMPMSPVHVCSAWQMGLMDHHHQVWFEESQICVSLCMSYAC